MKLQITTLLFFFISLTSNAQLLITNKEFSSKKITYEIQTTKKYTIQLKNKTNKISFPGFSDESKPGEASIPNEEIFLAIPPNSNPKVSFEILSQKEFDGAIEINPNVFIQGDELIYEKSVETKFIEKDFFRVKGKLWIDNNYCIHLQINPFYIKSNRRLRQVEKFKLTLSFTEEVQAVEVKDIHSVNNGILNPELAQNFVSRPFYSLEQKDTWIDYSKTYVKLGVAEDGIYRIYKNNLESLGISVGSINPNTFKLFLKGNELPIFVKGENDFIFDEQDFIEFVGTKNMGGHHREVSNFDEPYNEYLDRYTDTTVYWLTWDGVIGKRVDISETVSELITDTLNYYSQIDHYESNKWFDYSMNNIVRRELPYWTENKTWHEGNLNVGIRNKNFSVANVFPNKSFKMFTKFQDYASNITSNAHLVSLGLNSTEQWSDSIFIDKYEQVVLQTELNSNLLNNGTNTLKINSIPTEATINACIFDWYEIEYPRYLIPYSDSLNFRFSFLLNPTPYIVKLVDVSDDQIVCWKYGDNFKKYMVSNNSGEVIFSDTISSSDDFSFSSEAKIKSPKFYYSKQFKNLRDSENKGDYILIYHNKFKDGIDAYLTLISENYNLQTKSVSIDDIYDEYAFGFFNPEAIKDFLISTHNYWQNPRPQYVLLVGGATYDYYGYKHQNFGIDRVINYVPSYGAPVSDNWFVIWDTTGANIPQMNIGRLPVTSQEEFNWYYEKHSNYVTQAFDDWNKSYLFFSGGNEKDQGELIQLKAANQSVIDEYALPAPIGGKVEHFYKTVDPNSNFGPYTREYYDEAISNGSVFISYIGHSGTQTWDNSIINPIQLQNDRNRYPIVSDFGCSTGKFGEPDITSFSQLFTLSNDGQALGYIGNTSLGFLSTSLTMPKLFYKKILNEGIYNIGEAHKQAKMELLTNYGSTGVYELFTLTNSLIGDPIITLPIPEKPNLILNNNEIKITSNNYTDLDEKIELEYNLLNFGKVLNDSTDIVLIHNYLGESDTLNYRTKLPLYSELINTSIEIKNKPGQHQLQIILDPQNRIDEIYEEDNFANMSFYVPSSKLRALLDYQIENGLDGKIKFLNPIQKSSDEQVIIEYSNSEDFLDAKSSIKYFDTVSTAIEFSDLDSTQRYWFRTKRVNTDLFSSTFSLNSSEEAKYLIADSISAARVDLKTLSFKNNAFVIDTAKISFKLLSAGFSDGNTVLIEKNLVNYVFDATLRGHYVTVFEDSTYHFIDSKVFDILSGGSARVDEYISFLDSLKENYLVLFAIKDEGGSNLSVDLREKIKEFGSVFIDSVGFRDSWVLFGKKNAKPGSMPEAFSDEGNGYVEIDTTISFISNFGDLVTGVIGPSSNWQILKASASEDANIKFYPITISSEEKSLDTLEVLSIRNGQTSLNHIDAKKFPYLKILAEFENGDNNISPELYSLGVDYVSIPELAINYQVVSIEKDSLLQGEDVNLNFYVYNVGESAADSFSVTVDMVNPDNSKQRIFTTIVDSLGTEERKKFEVSYNTTLFNGERSFEISIDGENNVTELFEDNNFYSIPFFVKGDTTKPSMLLTIDGNDIFEGEYISSNPDIKIELRDPSLIPITDTSSISIFLNNRYINYLGNEDNIKINFSELNPKVTVNFTPKLEDGEYTLRVFGKDASGNVGDSAGITKYFNVSNDPKLLQVYNYPNPFSSDTYFTFKLTQIPDDIKIKIFTVAGRLIREISRNSSQLNYDLNKIHWNGRDNDGDLIGNGVYLYKVIMNVNGKKTDITQKLAVVR